MSKSKFLGYAAIGFGAAFLASTSIFVCQKIENSITEDGITVLDNGTALAGPLKTTTYDFKNASVINFGAPAYRVAFSELSGEQQIAYNNIHQQACKIAQAHKGYEQVCIGLKLD